MSSVPLDMMREALTPVRGETNLPRTASTPSHDAFGSPELTQQHKQARVWQALCTAKQQPVLNLLEQLEATMPIDSNNTQDVFPLHPLGNEWRGLTPLHDAAINGDPVTLHLLLQAKPNVHVKTQEGKTALDRAVERQTEDVVQVLLEAGANPNSISKGGSTPLHLACYNDHSEMVKVLLDAGANVSAVDQMYLAGADEPVPTALITFGEDVVRDLNHIRANAIAKRLAALFMVGWKQEPNLFTLLALRELPSCWYNRV
ncbi:uncharacterized protein MONBRDRAFT_13059 [Monosiga brevicollis MX1]|uniref:Uncharacterized protein n=1 Tax=Monosiga brevicollis TaxID=81824 RepID=A9VE63_MONBE|nr:uncharacterized protein MONBRDRAFT_13059 [Monosiga brevicollis MX1]EDQ84185.1 predicted protein [Monosiga brevicollis MX1]|eukprot:XP_001751015.1 hypothetical protein [Monosiga brevicollis MX1]